MKGDDIAERFLHFSIGILKLCSRLRSNPIGKHVASQLIRSGTSGGANYEEARRAESRADFVHKIRLATKELCESNYWLKLIEYAELHPISVRSLIDQGNELTAILLASAKTARANSVR